MGRADTRSAATGQNMNVAALCAGYGGLELGLGLTGVDVTLTWYAETDPHASAVMAAHHPHAPNLGDLTAITDPPPVDIVTAGFPCQPVSQAGKRKGIHDERWLIDDVCKIGRRTGADRLILENVAGLLSANNGDAMARVVSALAENGFHARWTCVRASDIGAPHQRLRWFCIAYPTSSGRHWRQERYEPHMEREHRLPAQRSQSDRLTTRSLSSHADAGGVGWAERTGPGESGQGRVGRNGPHDNGGTIAADAESAKRRDTQPELLGASVGPATESGKRHRSSTPDAKRFGPYADAIERWEPIVGRAAPDPTDNRRRLNPRFVEWMMGLPDGWVTDVIPNRSPALKILGNGVVPQQAAYALTLLEQM